MKKKPLVSILIANYNYGRYLRQCLESVYDQDYDNYEVIFSDNQSTDDSMEIALEYKEKFRQKGIWFSVSQNKRNIGSAGNTAVAQRASEGEYFSWFSSDDAMKPGYISKLANVLNENPNVGYVIAERDEMDDKGTIKETAPFYNKSCVIDGEEQAAVYMMAGVGVSSQIMFRRSTYYEMLQSKSLRFQVAGDWYDNFMMACFADVGYIKDSLVLYRVHNQNETALSEKNLVGIFEHYQLVHAFCTIADSFGFTKPQKRLEEAVHKLGNMCLRYALKMFKAKENRAAERYLKVAEVYKEDIVEEKLYQQLKVFSSMTTEEQESFLKEAENNAIAKRTVSYDPPEKHYDITDGE